MSIFCAWRNDFRRARLAQRTSKHSPNNSARANLKSAASSTVGPKVGRKTAPTGGLVGHRRYDHDGFLHLGCFASAFGNSVRFGLGAVIALIHDVLVTIGALMLAHYEFDLTMSRRCSRSSGSPSTTPWSSAIGSRKYAQDTPESLESVINTQHQRNLKPHHHYDRHGHPCADCLVLTGRRGHPALCLCLARRLFLGCLFDDFYCEPGYSFVG